MLLIYPTVKESYTTLWHAYNSWHWDYTQGKSQNPLWKQTWHYTSAALRLSTYFGKNPSVPTCQPHVAGSRWRAGDCQGASPSFEVPHLLLPQPRALQRQSRLSETLQTSFPPPKPSLSTTQTRPREEIFNSKPPQARQTVKALTWPGSPLRRDIDSLLSNSLISLGPLW